jgi:hypothetical protein
MGAGLSWLRSGDRLPSRDVSLKTRCLGRFLHHYPAKISEIHGFECGRGTLSVAPKDQVATA